MDARPSKGSILSRLFRTSAAVAALLVAVALAPLGAGARGHATPTPTASPTLPPEDPAITLIVRREFVSWQAGTINLDRYAESSRPSLTPDKIAETSKNLGGLGTLESTEWLGPIQIIDAPPGVKGSYLYKMHCELADVYAELTMMADGKIAGLLFRDKLPTP
jgi:hypothetical protein